VHQEVTGKTFALGTARVLARREESLHTQPVGDGIGMERSRGCIYKELLDSGPTARGC
jgi:hypothetical protein